MKESNYLLFKKRLHLFKGQCLLFFPNVPGAMFIQGGTFIPDSRVIKKKVPPTFPFFHLNIFEKVPTGRLIESLE